MVYNGGSTRFLVVVYLVELSERTWYDGALAVRTCILYIFNHTGGRKNLKWGVFGGDLSPFPVRCEGASLNPGPGYQWSSPWTPSSMTLAGFCYRGGLLYASSTGVCPRVGTIIFIETNKQCFSHQLIKFTKYNLSILTFTRPNYSFKLCFD